MLAAMSGVEDRIDGGDHRFDDGLSTLLATPRGLSRMWVPGGWERGLIDDVRAVI